MAGPLIAAGVQVAAGMIGNAMAAGDRAAASRMYEQILRDYQNLKIPEIEKQQLDLLLKEQVGEFAPEELTLEAQKSDYLDSVQADPRLRQSRMEQLSLLQEMAKTGMTPAEMAQANKLQRMQAAEAQSKIADIERQSAQTGMKSSGASLIAKLQAAQAARNQMAADKDALLGQMSNRRLSATESAGSLAGSLEDTDYGRAIQKAQTKMDIDRFNLQNQNLARQTNVSARNQAALRNLEERQRIAESNVNTRNQQQQYNKELLQQRYQNQLSRLQRLSGARQNMASVHSGDAQRTADMWSGVGQGVGAGIGSYAKYKQDQDQFD